MLSALLGEERGAASDFRGWAWKMPITLTGYGKSETLTNFPVLVTLHTNLTGFRYADFDSPATGADLRFAASNEIDELNYEIERWDANGVSYAWVQVPRVAGTNTCVYAFWGKTGQAAPAYATNGATWTNGFRGVWHLNDTNAFDSTTNRYKGTSYGNTNAAGAVAGSQRFSDSSHYIILPTNTYAPPMTLELWMYVDSLYDYGDPFGKEAGFSFCTYADGHNGFYVGNGSSWGNPYLVTPAGALSPGQWVHAVGTANGSQVEIFLNGQSRSNNNNNLSPGTFAAWIGQRNYAPNPGGVYPFRGRVDEVRWSSTVRSTNWIWACWTNQVAGSAFLAYGPVRKACGGGVLTLY